MPSPSTDANDDVDYPSKAQCLILTLPRELRDMIYRYLLRSDKVYRPADDVSTARRYDYQVALLRCNRQIHDEATLVLYRENTFILILSWYYQFEEMQLPIYPSFRAWQSYIAAIHSQRFRFEVEITFNYPSSNAVSHIQRFLIITPWELPMILHSLCRLRLAPRIDDEWECEILFTHPPREERTRATILDTVLALQDLPNRPSTIHIRGDPSAETLRKEFPIGTGLRIDACIKRAEKFETRGDGLLFSLDTSNEYAAYRSYQVGFCYVTVLKKNEPVLVGVTEKKSARLAEKHTWMRLACSIYAMDNGFLGNRIKYLEIAMQKYLQLPITVAVKTGLYIGMVLMEHSRELQAIYYLRMALFFEPGLPKAEQKVEELDQRIQLDTRLKDRLAGAFDLIMTPVRHRTHRRMSRSEQRQRFELDTEERDLVAAITRVKDAGLPRYVPADDEQNNTGQPIPMTSFPEISSLVALVRKRSRDAGRELVWDEVWQELISVALGSIML